MYGRALMDKNGNSGGDKPNKYCSYQANCHFFSHKQLVPLLCRRASQFSLIPLLSLQIYFRNRWPSNNIYANPHHRLGAWKISSPKDLIKLTEFSVRPSLLEEPTTKRNALSHQHSEFPVEQTHC